MAVEKAIGSSSLVEVIDRILDKGVVVDAWVRVSLVGIELLEYEQEILPKAPLLEWLLDEENLKHESPDTCQSLFL